MRGMRIQTFMYGTPSGVYTMDVHDCVDCEDRSYHISAMMSEGPSIQDAADIAVRLRRLEGVVTAVMMADRHYVVETRMPWDSIEPEMLIILNNRFDLAYLAQNHGGPTKRLFNDDLSTIEQSLANTLQTREHGIPSLLGSHIEQSIYGEGLRVSMGIPDDSREKYRGIPQDVLGIEKGDRNSPPTLWDYDKGGKYPRPR